MKTQKTSLSKNSHSMPQNTRTVWAVTGNLDQVDVTITEEIQELDGKLAKQTEEEKLMSSVLENDTDTVDQGNLIKDAINRGIGSFTPDLMFEQLVNNYSIAKNILGPTIIRELTGYDSSYCEKNIRIPEFQKELKSNIGSNISKLKENKLLGKGGEITEAGFKLASMVLYTQELDKLKARGLLGEKMHKKSLHYGDKEDVKDYHKGDRYRDLAIKRSVKLAIRRQSPLGKTNLKTFERQSKGQIFLVYGLDASGSMKGDKLDTCKKAGVALAFKAIEEKDKVGLLVFGADIKDEVFPTGDFRLILEKITRIQAAKETNIAKTILKSIEMFPNQDVTKHLILITDAMPTAGDKPEDETLKAANIAREHGITISLIGIQLDKEGKRLAQDLTKLGGGKLYLTRSLKEVDQIVLEDYYSVC
ncbi:MAG: VWA domain-containing protein [Nanoarchaeota archaeon]|nr:VWA domain-containing protein [Nanoarchaeota archaeon]